MRCDEFEERWHDLLDRRVDPAGDAELDAHLRQCAPCRKLATSLRRALDCLDAAAHPASQELTRRILQAVATDRAGAEHGSSPSLELPPRRPGVGDRFAWQWWAAVAAAALVAVTSWRFSPWPPADDVQPQDMVNQPSPAVPLGNGEAVVAKVEPLPVWDELAADSKASALELADKTKRSLDDALAIASLWGAREEIPQDDVEGMPWYLEMADGVAPIKDSTVGTWNVLKGLVAPGEENL